MLLCVVYRQPNAKYPFWDKFQQSVENATNYSSNVVITGDLNVDYLSEHSSRTLQLSYTKTGSSKDWRVLHVLVGSVIMFFQIIQSHKIK
jgi:exonuclease III